MYPVDQAGELFGAWRAWASTAPEEAMSRALFCWMPEAPELPPAVHNQQVFIVGAIYTGPAEEGQRVLQPLRELGTPPREETAAGELVRAAYGENLQRLSLRFNPGAGCEAVWWLVGDVTRPPCDPSDRTDVGHEGDDGGRTVECAPIRAGRLP